MTWLYDFFAGPLNTVAWIYILLPCVFVGGLYFTIGTGAVQFRRFGYAMKNTIGKMFKKTEAEPGAVTPLQAVTTALAATVGTGNIVGTSQAIALGGYGAIFWLWLAALLGMVIKFAEVTLSVRFREKDEKGDWVGGPMYYIKNGLGPKWKWLAVLFCIFAILASFGIGNMSQANSIMDSIKNAILAFNPDVTNTAAIEWGVGIFLAVVTAAVLFGGIKRIGAVTEKFIPFMSALYIIFTLIVIGSNIGGIIPGLKMIVVGAFSPQAVLGAGSGIALKNALIWGLRRSAFSNEAGLGSAAIAHAAAQTEGPVQQGVFGIFEVFMDTIVICTLTGFVVVMGHCWLGDGGEAWMALDKLPMFTESIAALTPGTALNAVMSVLVSLCFCLFAYTCLIGMISFSEIAANRIKQNMGFINAIRIIALAVATFGILCNIAGLELGNLWAFSDLGNILIVFFNVPIIYVGAKYVFKATAHYKKDDGTPFTSAVIDRDDCQYWDERAKNDEI